MTPPSGARSARSRGILSALVGFTPARAEYLWKRRGEDAEFRSDATVASGVGPRSRKK